jgi:hypothetical protein
MEGFFARPTVGRLFFERSGFSIRLPFRAAICLPLPRLAGEGKADVRARSQRLIDGKPPVMNTPSWQNFVADQENKLNQQVISKVRNAASSLKMNDISYSYRVSVYT